MATAKILHKSDIRLTAILAARASTEEGCLIHPMKTMSYKGGIHALAKLSYAVANRMTLDEINASGQWVKRTCKNALCTNALHLELSEKGAKKLSEDEKIDRQLEKDEKSIFAEFAGIHQINQEEELEEEKKKEYTEEELEEESNRIMQELAAEVEAKEPEKKKELPELNW